MNKDERNIIYKDIQKEVKERFNIDLSLQEINSVTQSQYKIAVHCFTKGFAVALPFIGTFVPIDFSYYVDNLIEPNKKKQQALIDEGREEEAVISMKESIANYKRLIKDKRQGVTSADTVIHSPSIGEIPETVDIYKTFK